MFAWLSPSGRELFLLDASLFVDDAEAYDKYQRQEQDTEQKVRFYTCPFIFIFYHWRFMSFFVTQYTG